MAFCCPLADEVGKLSDWVAVGVGAIAAGVTVWVGLQAKKAAAEATSISREATSISERATSIADEAKRIAQQQHQEMVTAREETARILGSLLDLEIAMLPAMLGAFIEVLDEATIANVGTIIGRQELNKLLADMSYSPLPASEDAQERLHNLKHGLGDDVARLIGMWKGLHVASKRVAARLPTEDDSAEVVIPTLVNQNNDLMLLRDSLLAMLSASIGVAKRFAKFAGSQPEDYSREEALLKVKR